MTVVVGIYCRDGVVIAADSALTINGVIEEAYLKKIACLADDLVVGFAGDLGFAQRFRQVAKDIWDNPERSQIGPDEFHKIIESFYTNGILEFLKYVRPTDSINIPSAFVVGFAHAGRHHLCTLPHGNFQPMVINENLPFCSLGSGLYLTNPFLSFIKKVFWSGESCPKLSVGIFSAVMAMNLAVDLNIGGINAPIHIAVLERKNNLYTCRKLHEDELSTHQENCKEALDYFSKYSHFFDRENIKKAPHIPKMDL
jgi:20S proteasome alpha/beta subunit